MFYFIVIKGRTHASVGMWDDRHLYCQQRPHRCISRATSV